MALALVGGAWILLRTRATARERAGAPADAGAQTDRETGTGTGPTTEGPTGTAQPRGGRE